MGAIESLRWHSSHLAWKIGAMSLVKVMGFAVSPVVFPFGSPAIRQPENNSDVAAARALTPATRPATSNNRAYNISLPPHKSKIWPQKLHLLSGVRKCDSVTVSCSYSVVYATQMRIV